MLPFAFDSGRLCLDLTATLSDRSHERLTDLAAMAAWLVAAGFGGVPLAPGDLERLRELRAAISALVEASLHGRAAPRGALERLNATAARDVPAPRLTARFTAERRLGDAGQVAALIARDAVDMLSGPERALLRECAADDCSGIYVDASRGRTRRWCSSQRCGNRARVAAHRARRA